jgi:preprotein translocase subunit SecE
MGVRIPPALLSRVDESRRREGMGPNKAVHLMFLTGGLILFLLLKWTGDWIWGYFARSPNEFVMDAAAVVIALVAGIVLYRNERVYALANDVATELKKVTWPTRKETQAATIVVIVTVILAAIILGAFDLVWSFATDRIYG